MWRPIPGAVLFRMIIVTIVANKVHSAINKARGRDERYCIKLIFLIRYSTRVKVKSTRYLCGVSLGTRDKYLLDSVMAGIELTEYQPTPSQRFSS